MSSNINLPATLLLCLLYLRTFVRASSAVPAIGKAAQSSLVLSSNTRPGASSVFPTGNLTSTYYGPSRFSLTSSYISSKLLATAASNSNPLSTSSAQAAFLNSTTLSSAAGSGQSSKPTSSSLQGSPSDFGATIIIGTVSGEPVSETFVPTTYTEYASLTTTLLTDTTDAQSKTIPLIIGPGGVGWQVPSVSSNALDIPPPTVLPSSPRSSSAISSSPITQHPSSTYTLSATDLTPTSIEGVTKNTKTTTSQGGHRTILPIVFCPRCGGSHGTSWIIHPPSIHPPGGIELHIPGVKWPFTVTPDGDPEPLDPSEPEPEPDNDDNESTSNESISKKSTVDGTTSRSESTFHSTSSSVSSSLRSSSISSTGSSQVSGKKVVATSIDVDPYATEIPQDQIAEVQSYLSSLFAAELDQLGTTLEPLTTSANPTTGGSSITSSTTAPPRPTQSPSALSTGRTPPGAGTTAALLPATTMDCSNPSPEDGDGLCTCSYGTQLIGTYTPNGGICPTLVPASVSVEPMPPATTITTSSPTLGPTSSALPPPPKTGVCNCNEDGCSDDSPACCGDGSCPASVAAVP